MMWRMKGGKERRSRKESRCDGGEEVRTVSGGQQRERRGGGERTKEVVKAKAGVPEQQAWSSRRQGGWCQNEGASSKKTRVGCVCGQQTGKGGGRQQRAKGDMCECNNKQGCFCACAKYRRLEGWPNTADRKGQKKRVTEDTTSKRVFTTSGKGGGEEREGQQQAKCVRVQQQAILVQNRQRCVSVCVQQRTRHVCQQEAREY